MSLKNRMTRMPLYRRTRLIFAACLLAPTLAFAQTPWRVTITPTVNPLPVGFCGAVQLTLMDPATKEVPRNPLGSRVTIADFDMTVSGGFVVGDYLDSTHFQVCGCQGGSPGSTGTITATYPGQSLAATARVPGVAFQVSAAFVLAPPKGTVNPPACIVAPAPINAPPASSPVSTTPPVGTPLPTPAPGPRTPGATPLIPISSSGATSRLRIQPVATVSAGMPFSVTVEAVDVTGAIDTAFNRSIDLSATAAGGASFLMTQASMIGGVVTFQGVKLDNAANNYTLTASGKLLSSVVSNSFNVTARGLRVGLISDTTAGTAFTVRVEAIDALDRVAENFTGSVTLHAAAAGGAPPTVAAVAGIATFPGVVLNTPANFYTLTASSSGLNDQVSNPFSVATGPGLISSSGARRRLRMQPVATVRAGMPFSVTVEAVDVTGAIDTAFNPTIDLSVTAGGPRSPKAQASMIGGVATFQGVMLDDAANNYTLTASGGLLSVVSNSFNVTARGLRVGVFSDIVAGTAFRVTVSAIDASGRVAENFTGSVTLHAAAVDGADFAAPPTVAAVAGIATFTGVVLNTPANSYTLTASSSGLNDQVSNAFKVD